MVCAMSSSIGLRQYLGIRFFRFALAAYGILSGPSAPHPRQSNRIQAVAPEKDDRFEDRTGGDTASSSSHSIAN